MKTFRCALLFAVVSLVASAALAANAPRDPAIPHLEKRGAATQLVVDGQPFLVLGGETANTISSNLDAMAPVWPRLVRMNLNTALVAVGWDWVEPQEGKLDFSLVDGLLAQARQHNMKVALLWFGSWKNGLSSFAPGWVKRDQARFPRVHIKNGRSVEILSVFGDATREADTKAFAAFMRHIRAVDATHRTVVMIQLQNEMGILGDSRDRLPAAEAAFAQRVPPELIAHFQRRGQRLWPELRKVWQDAGGKTTGTWTDVFGASTATDEIFMAWHYARYCERMAAAGKAEYPLPIFTNTWIVQPEDRGPGDYPTGGPEPLTIDIWRAGAPSIDFNAPDVYLPNFTEWAARFHRDDNPLFIPESRGDAGGAANAFYAIGAHAAIGYSPFGIDNVGRLVTLRPDATTAAPTELETLPLPRAYALLRQLTPLILEHQAKGSLAAVSLNAERPTQDVDLGTYRLHVDLRRNRRNPAQVPALGYAMLFHTGPDEYFVAGCDVQVTFFPRPGVAGATSADIVAFADAETGEFAAGKWRPGRKMNGDDILLRYDLAAAAAAGQSGSGLRFNGPNPTVQRVSLYRYR